MIAYHIAADELLDRIRTRFGAKLNKDGKPRKNGKDSWSTRAASESTRLAAQHAYDEDANDDISNELAPLFAEIQCEKCGYCERKLHVHKNGAVVGDVDHYRPKGGVAPYAAPHSISVGVSCPTCYHMLTYVPRNYVLSCLVCNRDFKKNYFPIAGARCNPNETDPTVLQSEQPYLIHPLDPDDLAPESLIQFEGINPIPSAPADTHEYWRARVTIELYGLGNGSRLDLDKDRAKLIESIWLALEIRRQTPDVFDAVAEAVIMSLDDNRQPHRNCCRSFHRIYQQNRQLAERFAHEASRVVNT
jgi:hypothetical protein